MPILLPVVLMICGVALRVWILASPAGFADSDEAVVGLMARRLLQGHVTPFFWGQAYGGMQEPAVVAIFFRVFGSTTVILKVVPILFDAVAAALVWRIGKHLLSPRVALVSGALYWAAPAGHVWLSTRELGFYGVAQVSVLLALLAVIRLRNGISRADAILLGLSIGSGWYATPQTAVVTVPAVVWLLIDLGDRRRLLFRQGGFVAVGAIVGGLPWLVANLHSGFFSLQQPAVPVATSYFDRLGLVFSTGIPIALGLRIPHSDDWVVPLLGPGLYFGLLALIVLGVSRALRGTRHSLLGVVVVAYPLLIALPRTSYTQWDGRYMHLLLPALVLLGASLYTSVRWRGLAVVGALAIAPLTIAGTMAIIDGTRADWSGPGVLPDDPTMLVQALEQRRVGYVFADYWIAYRITFASSERIVATPMTDQRRTEYDTAVRTSFAPAYVVWSASSDDERLAERLTALGVPYDIVLVGRYAVVLPEARVLPEQLV